MIAFASSFPGSIVAFDITPDKGIIVQKSGFLASEEGVNLAIHYNRRHLFTDTAKNIWKDFGYEQL